MSYFSGYINGSTIIPFRVNCYGELIITPSSPGPEPPGPTPTSYYITWTPTTLTGSFSINGTYYNFSDYPSGTFTDSSFSGVITSGAFMSKSIVTLDTNATTVSNSAFRSCSSMTQATLSTCISINDYAFYSCFRLSQVSIPACEYIGRDAFNRCNSLTQVSLPECSYIASAAFYSCTSLSEIDLPVCTYIGNYAFYNCSSLSQVSLPECSYIDSYAFDGCRISMQSLVLPVCEYIGSYAFSGMYVSELTLPKCSYIGDWGLYGPYLKKVTLPGSSMCRLDGSSVFMGTPSVYVPMSLLASYKYGRYWSSFSSKIYPIASTSYYINWTPSIQSGSFLLDGSYYAFAVFPSGISGIGSTITASAFKSVGFSTITTNVSGIGSYAFYNCSSLTQASLPEVLTIESNAFESCSTLTSLNLPVCTSISLEAFYGDNNLVSLSAPVLTDIGDEAFGGCWLLSDVSIPQCEQIGLGAFHNCSSLSQLSLPNCEYIDDIAFAGCVSLASLTLAGSSVVELGTGVFASTPIASGTGSVYVPSSLVDTYKSAVNWSSISSRIFPIGGESYYINWMPYSLSTGTFTIAGVQYNFSDYNGRFTNFDGVITPNAFMMNHSITAIYTNATYIGDGAFDGCNNLVSADLTACSFLSEEAFYGCTFLDTLYLRSTSVVRVGGPYVLSGTPIVDGNGFVYVPSSLVTAYQNSSDWASVSNWIMPINN